MAGLLLFAACWGKRSSTAQAALDLELGRKSQAREAVFLRDTDLRKKIVEDEQKLRGSWKRTLLLAYLSCGVIYGDIGTGVIYVFASVFWAGQIGDYYEYTTTNSTTGYSYVYYEPDAAAYRQDVLGIFSLIFWLLTLIALMKYVGVVLSASDAGEGGTVALYAHLCRTMGLSPFGTMKERAHRQVLIMQSACSDRSDNSKPRRQGDANGGASAGAGHPSFSSRSRGASSEGVRLPVFRPLRPPLKILVLEGERIVRWFRASSFAQNALLLVTMLATGLVIGDGVVMPAFTVVSAIDVLEYDGLVSHRAVSGISCAILVLLFVMQHIGTERISFLFSPIIILWLLANLGIGIYNLHLYGGDIFSGLNPRWIFVLLAKYSELNSKAFQLLGGSMLCVAGAETMFAAVGHFTQQSVAWAFGCFVYPCLVITYLGQGAFQIHNQGSRPFWDSIPERVQWPMFALAMLAAIVASQAVITGSFSIIRQASALGIFPKLRILHTDTQIEGRIFIPFVNYFMMAFSVAIVIGFSGGDTDPTDNLANAYGVAVMAVMLCTTFLLLLTALVNWDVSLLIVLPVFFFYGAVEGVLLTANLLKVPNGSWVPLSIAFVIFVVMCVWWSGSYRRRRVLLRARALGTTLIRTTPGADDGRMHMPLLPSSTSLDASAALAALSLTAAAQADRNAAFLLAENPRHSGRRPFNHSGLPPSPRVLLAPSPLSKLPGLLHRKHEQHDQQQHQQQHQQQQQERRSDRPAPSVPGPVAEAREDPLLLEEEAGSSGGQHTGGHRASSLLQRSFPGEERTSPRGLRTSLGGELAPPGGQHSSPGGGPAFAEGLHPSSAEEPAFARGQRTSPGGEHTSPWGSRTSPGGQPTLGGVRLSLGEGHTSASGERMSAGGEHASAGGERALLETPPPQPLSQAVPTSSQPVPTSSQPVPTSSQPVPASSFAGAAPEARVAAGLGGVPASPWHLTSSELQPGWQARWGASTSARAVGTNGTGSGGGPGSPRPGSLGPAEAAASFIAVASRPDKPLARVTGLGIYYGETPTGLPLVMKHFLRNVDAIHEVCIILIVRFLPMPSVRSTERLLVRPVKGMPNFYQVVARYGYKDEVDHSDVFVSKLISTIMFKLELKAGLKYEGRQDELIHELEGDEAASEDGAAAGQDGSSHRRQEEPQVYGLEVIRESYLGEEEEALEEMAKWEAERTFSPFISRYVLERLSRIRIVAASPGAPQAAKDAQAAAQALLETASAQVVYYRARTFTRPSSGVGAAQKLYNSTVGAAYATLESFAYADVEEWQIPADSLVELGIAVEI